MPRFYSSLEYSQHTRLGRGGNEDCNGSQGNSFDCGPADSWVVQSTAQMWLGLWLVAAASVITQSLWPLFHP